VMSGPLVVIMRPGHPLAGKLDLPAYLAAQHVLVSSRREGPGMEDFGLSRLGYRRNIRLRCQHHMAALSTVMGSDLLLTLPGLLARQLAPAGSHVEPLPADVPGLELHLYWHRDQSADPGHTWLRQRVMAMLAEQQSEPC